MPKLDVKTEWITSSANRGVFSGLRDFYNARAILFALVRRELKARYRGSVLGFAWVLGRPLVTLLIFSLIFGEILGGNRSVNFFALYLFVGLMFWNFFSESVSVSAHSLIVAEGLIQKVSFPREILPVTSVVIAFINLLIQVPILLLGYAYFEAWPNLENFTFLLLLVFILFIFSLSLALLVSSITVYVRDLKPLTDLILMVLMYSTPILYSWTFVSERLQYHYQTSLIFEIYISNPLAILITGIQDTLWPGKRYFSNELLAPQLFSMTSVAIWALFAFVALLLLASYKIFLKLEPNFAREL